MQISAFVLPSAHYIQVSEVAERSREACCFEMKCQTEASKEVRVLRPSTKLQEESESGGERAEMADS